MTDLVVIEPEDAAENVIAVLERALEMARTGEISSVAVAIVKRDGVAHHLWSRLPSIGLMLGAVARLTHKLNLEFDQ